MSASVGTAAWQGHAMRAARRSIESHARRLQQARSYRGRELAHGWGQRWFGPPTEVEKPPRPPKKTPQERPASFGFATASERFVV